jgi:hypothetical protein
METHVYQGRTYRVLAEFTGFDRATETKNYMRTHPHSKVLCDEDGKTVIVFETDRGRLPPKPDDWSEGWSSLLDGGVKYQKEPKE